MPITEVNMKLVVACALVDIDGRILVVQRPPGKPMAGLWEFPGGKVEKGERPEQALIRELKEEIRQKVGREQGTSKEQCLQD